MQRILWQTHHTTKDVVEFVDYILQYYVTPESRYHPMFWVVISVNDSKRTTNGTESFQADFNAQFYSDHPKIYFYLDVIKKIQTTAYTSTWGNCIPIVECRTRSIYTLSCISTNCMSEEKFQGVDVFGQLHIYIHVFIQIILREQICNLQPNLYSSAIITVFLFVVYVLRNFNACEF